MVNIEDIRSFFKGEIKFNEPLSDHTSFRIGGPTDYYFEPKDKNDLIGLVSYLDKIGLPYLMLGNGTNLLVNDDGIKGAVISLEKSLNNKRFENDLIYAEAGIKLSKFVEFCALNGKKGVEMLAGIPGSLGGALIMNASAFNGVISDHLFEVEVYDHVNVRKFRKEEIEFKYRSSSLSKYIVLEASFNFPNGDTETIQAIRKELLDYRKAAQPVQFPSAGCVFKNPEGHHAAVLIQEANLKGKKIGGAEVSDLHGNFIINSGNAKAQDVIDLIKYMRKVIKETKNIDLELEVKLIGYQQNIFDV